MKSPIMASGRPRNNAATTPPITIPNATSPAFAPRSEAFFDYYTFVKFCCKSRRRSRKGMPIRNIVREIFWHGGQARFRKIGPLAAVLPSRHAPLQRADRIDHFALEL